jgi:hypothetical protein
MSKETSEWMKHINFTFARLKSFYFFFFIFIFFSDTTIPLLHFLHPNTHDDYKLEGRKAIFKSDNKEYEIRSLILKEGTKDLIIEVFELFYFVFNYYLLLIIFFIYYFLF